MVIASDPSARGGDDGTVSVGLIGQPDRQLAKSVN